MAMFDYVLRPEARSWRGAFAGALRPIIVLGALIAFMIALASNRPKPVKQGPTEVRFAVPLPSGSPGDFKLPARPTPAKAAASAAGAEQGGAAVK
ncbi:hypothetical protein [Pendulispora albinea]|uniref:SPOR domain-containing protein n=1 Tax=Pendulispora albinea TaxID=2741071 RepID=A0ABZ2LYU5_9BACT